jgi:cation:H+ antiporter
VTGLQFVGGLALLVGGAELLVSGASKLARSFRVPRVVVGLTVVAFGTSSPELAVSVQAALRGNADVAFGNVCGSNVFNVLFILGLSACVAPLVVSKKLVRVEVPLMIATSGAMWALAPGGVSRAEGAALFGALLLYLAFQVREARREGEAEEGGGDARRTAGARLAYGFSAAAGLALLVLGSDLLVEASVRIARYFGMSDLVVGLTIIAAGTSLPEVATSVLAVCRGEREIAVANVVGSNVFNVLGVLGAAAAIAPSGVAVSRAALAFDVPVMFASAVACLPIFFTGHRISRWEGALFLFYYAAYVGFLVLNAARHAALPYFSSAMLLFVMPLTAATLAVVLLRAVRERSSRDAGATE